MKQQILEMLELQDRMNSRINPDWRAANNPWYRAVWTECAEMLDHYGWKWWKHQQADMEQVKLEVVDIWHFVLSDYLNRIDDIETLAGILSAELSMTPQCDDLRCSIELMAMHTLQHKAASAEEIAGIMHYCDMNFDELYSTYIGKNVLNFFRQDHGYKDGTYVKMWNGREDNEYLAEILEASDVSEEGFSEKVYQKLEEAYPE